MARLLLLRDLPSVEQSLLTLVSAAPFPNLARPSSQNPSHTVIGTTRAYRPRRLALIRFSWLILRSLIIEIVSRFHHSISTHYCCLDLPLRLRYIGTRNTLTL